MKRTTLKIMLSCALLGASLLIQKSVYADVQAPNCTYTGEDTDYCYTSDGTHNIKVLDCAPGSTDCSYTPPA